MADIKFILDGKELIMTDEVPKEETGIVDKEVEFEKTKEFKPLTDEEIKNYESNE